jgi:site-specific recombinase XerD
MSKKSFHSFLAKDMRNFAALRQMEGKDYGSQTWNLVYFDRFLRRVKWKRRWISRELVDDYCLSKRHLSAGTRGVMLSVVRQFCRYLSQFDARCYVPDGERRAVSPEQSLPFVLTQAQVCELLARAGELPVSPSSFSLRPCLYQTLVGLLYTTGMRIAEALALNIGDLDLRLPRLLIRKGKFGKTRWIPLSHSTAGKLDEFLKQRSRIAPASTDSPLFISCRADRLSYDTAYATFRRILSACHMAGRAREGPTIHSLRHTFACHRLLEWYRDGLDIHARLPALSTYMGHVNVHFTHRYVHATPELLHETHQRFLEHYRKTIKPEVIHE